MGLLKLFKWGSTSVTQGITATADGKVPVEAGVPLLKGAVSTVLNAVTATTTSGVIDCSGYNALLIDYNVTALTAGSWQLHVIPTLDNDFAPSVIVGYETSGGAWAAITSNAAAPFLLASVAKRVFPVLQIPDFVKIQVFLTTGPGTVTVKVQPFNI